MSAPTTPPPGDPYGQQPPPPPGAPQPPMYDPSQQGFAPPPPPPPAYDPNAYQQQGYPPGYQQPYQQPYAGGPGPFDSRATTVLILGILGLLICQILGPVAWMMGNGVKKEAEAAGYPEPGNNKAGRICGIIGTVFLALAIVGFIIAFAVGATRASVTVN